MPVRRTVGVEDKTEQQQQQPKKKKDTMRVFIFLFLSADTTWGLC
jgi:hypothetical protein